MYKDNPLTQPTTVGPEAPHGPQAEPDLLFVFFYRPNYETCQCLLEFLSKSRRFARDMAFSRIAMSRFGSQGLPESRRIPASL
jgi:hypothetical protein